MSEQFLKQIIRYLANEAEDKDHKEVNIWQKENKAEFDKIKSIYNNMPFDQKDFNIETQKAIVLKKIKNDLKHKPSGKKRNLYEWLKVAAVFLGLLAIGSSLYFYDNSLNELYQNTSQQTLEISLPDGSLVTLDKNASLEYKFNWLQQFNRKVALSGRAYFQIEKKEGANFIVSTSRSQVEVLGTKFTVSDNFNKTQIVLNEGHVKVTSELASGFYMLKENGEQLIITEKGEIKSNEVNQNLYFSWLNDKINFDNCKVSETIDFLSDSYNLNIQMADKNALNKQLMGSAPSDNPQLIIEAIAKITDQSIRNEGNIIILE